MEYILHILILIGIYTILSVSLNLLVGYTGILSVAHAAFYGVGAYIAALMALRLNSPFLLNIFLAVIGAAVIGGIVGFPSLRIKDDYFVIATFAFQIITFSILINLVTKAFETIKEINQNFQTTILIVEQKVKEVLKIADFIYGLRMGKIVFSGSPKEIQQEDNLKKIFLL